MIIDTWIRTGHNQIWAMLAYLAFMILVVVARNVWYERRLDNEGYVPMIHPLWATVFTALILLPPIYLMSVDLLNGLITLGFVLLFSFGASDAVRAHFKHKRNTHRGTKTYKA